MGAEPIARASIAAEIRRLRKGRGINAPDLLQHLGPQLKRLAGITEEASDPALERRRLIDALKIYASTLPKDLNLAISASLGLTDEFRGLPKFTDRIQDLAAVLGYEPRTALRRVDDAERLMAEAIAEATAEATAIELTQLDNHALNAPAGWYLEELKVVLRLDTPAPESHERRRIVATRDNLEEVAVWFHLADATATTQPVPTVEVLYGGRLILQEQEHNLFRFVIRLPKPLKAGEKHDYGLIIRVIGSSLLSPHYLVTPECQCRAFDLRVRFAADHLPILIRKVSGETVRNFENPRWGHGRLALDSVGEVHVHFENLHMYLGYGVQWSGNNDTGVKYETAGLESHG